MHILVDNNNITFSDENLISRYGIYNNGTTSNTDNIFSNNTISMPDAYSGCYGIHAFRSLIEGNTVIIENGYYQIRGIYGYDLEITNNTISIDASYTSTSSSYIILKNAVIDSGVPLLL